MDEQPISEPTANDTPVVNSNTQVKSPQNFLIRFKDVILVILIIAISSLAGGIYIAKHQAVKTPDLERAQNENETTSGRGAEESESMDIAVGTLADCGDTVGTIYEPWGEAVYCPPKDNSVVDDNQTSGTHLPPLPSGGGYQLGNPPPGGFQQLQQSAQSAPEGTVTVIGGGIVVISDGKGGTVSPTKWQKTHNGELPAEYYEVAEYYNWSHVVEERANDPAWFGQQPPQQLPVQQGGSGTQTPVAQNPPASGGTAPQTRSNPPTPTNTPVPLVDDDASARAGAGAGRVGNDDCPDGYIGGAVAGDCIATSQAPRESSNFDEAAGSGVRAGAGRSQDITSGAGASKPVGDIVALPVEGSSLSSSSEAGVVVAVSVPGVGSNVSFGENSNPVRQKNIEIEIFDDQRRVIKRGNFAADRDSNLRFGKALNLGSDLTGQTYSGRVRLDNTLWKAVDIRLTPGQIVNVAPIELVSGDIDRDNRLSIFDYNALIACYNQGSCSNLEQADLNLDGKVDELDLNILLSSFRTRQGD